MSVSKRRKSSLLKRWMASQLAHPRGMTAPLLGMLWNRRNAALNKSALEALQLRDGERVLEVGFGGGALLAGILSMRHQGGTAGVDASAALVARAARKFRAHIRAGQLEIRRGRAENLPFVSDSFDKVVSVNSIFYWNDPAQGLREISRALRPGGLCVLACTGKQDLDRRGFAPEEVRSFTIAELEGLLRGAGFGSIENRCGRDHHRAFSTLLAAKSKEDTI